MKKMIFPLILLLSSNLAYAQHEVGGNGGDPRELFLLNRAKTIVDFLSAEDSRILNLSSDQTTLIKSMLDVDSIHIRDKQLLCVELSSDGKIFFSERCYEENLGAEKLDAVLFMGVLSLLKLNVDPGLLANVDWIKYEKRKAFIFDQRCSLLLTDLWKMKTSAFPLVAASLKSRGYAISTETNRELNLILSELLEMDTLPSAITRSSLSDMLLRITLLPVCIVRSEP